MQISKVTHSKYHQQNLKLLVAKLVAFVSEDQLVKKKNAKTQNAYAEQEMNIGHFKRKGIRASKIKVKLTFEKDQRSASANVSVMLPNEIKFKVRDKVMQVALDRLL